MENNKVVEMFDSIPKFETYSKYSVSLQRIFKNNSLKYLIKDLKSPKKIHELKNEKNKNGSEGKYFTDNINDLDDKIFVKIKEKENDDFFDVKFDIKQKKLMKKNKSLKEIRHEKVIQKKKVYFQIIQIHINIILIIMQYIKKFLLLNLFVQLIILLL